MDGLRIKEQGEKRSLMPEIKKKGLVHVDLVEQAMFIEWVERENQKHMDVPGMVILLLLGKCEGRKSLIVGKMAKETLEGNTEREL